MAADGGAGVQQPGGLTDDEGVALGAGVPVGVVALEVGDQVDVADVVVEVHHAVGADLHRHPVGGDLVVRGGVEVGDRRHRPAAGEGGDEAVRGRVDRGHVHHHGVRGDAVEDLRDVEPGDAVGTDRAHGGVLALPGVQDPVVRDREPGAGRTDLVGGGRGGGRGRQNGSCGEHERGEGRSAGSAHDCEVPP